MGTAAQNPQPTLIVVTGRPGSGKSTLVHPLARAIRCPAICRDEIKEGLINAAGQTAPPKPADQFAQKAYDAFFDTLELLLSRGVTLVAEASFQHKLWAPKLEPLRKIARVRIIVCAIDPALAQARHQERSRVDPDRERFHYNPLAPGREGTIGDYDPPNLDVPMLAVDTSDGYQPEFETIVSFARS